MEGMLRDLVDSASLESGQLEMRLEPTDLLRLVLDVVRNIGTPADQQRIEVQASGDQQLVQADPIALSGRSQTLG